MATTVTLVAVTATAVILGWLWGQSEVVALLTAVGCSAVASALAPAVRVARS